MGACCLSCDWLFELDAFDVRKKTAQKHAGVGEKHGDKKAAVVLGSELNRKVVLPG